jgi:hypothetical protein
MKSEREREKSIKKLSQGQSFASVQRADSNLKEKSDRAAAEMSINHNQRNKFSLVSLHVCNINFFQSTFYASECFFVRG